MTDSDIQQKIASIPAKYISTIQRLFVDKITYKEVALEDGVDYGTISRRVRRVERITGLRFIRTDPRGRRPVYQ